MLILHIFTNHACRRVERYAAAVMLGLHEAGVTQTILMPPGKSRFGEIRAAGVMIESRPLPAGPRVWQHFSLRRLIGRLRPNVIHCWTRTAAQALPPCDIPVIAWLGGEDDPLHFPLANYFVGVTPHIAAHLVNHNVPRANIRFIPVFSTMKPSPPLERNRLATPSTAKVLLNLSSLQPASRLDLLLKTLCDLPDCILWLAGQGPLRRELEAQARDTGVGDRVRFVEPGLDRGALLRTADLCVLTAPDESLGAIMQDSWTTGTPLIICGYSDDMRTNENDAGFLVADPSTLTHAIRRVLVEEDVRRHLVGQGYANGHSFYTRSSVIQQWAEFYRKISIQHSSIGIREEKGSIKDMFPRMLNADP